MPAVRKSGRDRRFVFRFVQHLSPQRCAARRCADTGQVSDKPKQLQTNEFFREFRQADVSLERWDRARTTGDRLKEALGFLYY